MGRSSTSPLRAPSSTRAAPSLRKKSSETTEKGLERARQILSRAHEIFAEEGYGALSMRRVALHLGVTLGSVQHYYKTKEDLLEAMLLRMLHEYQSDVDRIDAEMATVSPDERFRARMRYFIASVLSPTGRGTFAELYALSARHPYAARIMDRMFAQARRSIRRSIRGMVEGVSERELTLRSASIIAQLMGITFFQPTLPGLEEETLRTMLEIAKRPTSPSRCHAER